MDALFNLGGCLKAQGPGRLGEAVAIYERASRDKNNDDWELWYNLGVALGDSGRFADETNAYRRALDLNPTHAESWTNLGIASANQGNLNAALEVLLPLNESSFFFEKSEGSMQRAVQIFGP